MEARRWVLDEALLRVETDAEGMFSPLAHDLLLEARPSRGEAEGDPASGFSAWVALDPASLRVAGVRRRGRVERDVLSDRDRAEIERRVREGVFANVAELRAEAKGDAKGARLEVQCGPTRGAFALRVGRVDVQDDGTTARAEGDAVLSLGALGLGPVKGPLGAFRIADAVRVRWETRWKRG